jgi:ATP-binding cassette subfamily B protein
MSRATSDIGEAEMFVGARLAELIGVFVLITGVIAAMLLENRQLALIALIPIPVLIVATIRFGGTIRPMFKGIQTQLGILSSTMQESLTGINVVKAFAREPHELDKFDGQNQIWFDRRVRLVNTWANNWPFFTFLIATSIFLLLWFGGPMALRGEITIGSLFALMSYVLMLQSPVQMLGFIVNLTATAGSAAGRVFEIMDTANPVADRPNAATLPRVQGHVTFDNVRFGYQGGRAVLDGVSLEVQAGQKIALVGPTGSGKSTITNLLPRFYEPDSGRILIDGQDIRYVTLSSLRRQIGTVLQDSFLFSSTIAENIAYGHPAATQAEIEAAARTARAHDFIMSFPDQYNTVVGERGVTLSGGQKQRVAIARTLLTDPRILVLDDATSSVDTETEYLIQQALQLLMEGRTTFIIAQRLLTLKHADLILVVENGRIVQRGTHHELLQLDGPYRAIYDLQLKDQESLASLAAIA